MLFDSDKETEDINIVNNSGSIPEDSPSSSVDMVVQDKEKLF